MSRCLEGRLEPDWIRLQKGFKAEIEEEGVEAIINKETPQSAFAFTLFKEQQERAVKLIPFFDAKTCLEYGAGAGFLCHAMREQGYKGDYKIIDIPELWPVQKAYFKQHGVENVEWLDEIEEVDLVIAHFSVSEGPLDWRDEVFSWNPKYFHIMYQAWHTPVELARKFWGRNVEYFDNLRRDNKNYTWEKIDGQHVTLIGTRNDSV